MQMTKYHTLSAPIFPPNFTEIYFQLQLINVMGFLDNEHLKFARNVNDNSNYYLLFFNHYEFMILFISNQ
jgi:hypothetical protein